MSAEPIDTAVSPNEGTGAGMIAFLDHLIKRNEVPKETGVALRTGCRRVLEVEDDPGAVDIQALDVDGILQRYRNKYRGEVAERTLNNYDQRFRSTVEMYRKWLVDDPSWRPRSRSGSNKSAATPATKATNRTRAPRSGHVEEATLGHKEPEAQLPRSEVPRQGMITYPFPIRPGVQGSITLPDDLTPREAKRISAFITTLAFEEDEPQPVERLAITAGSAQG